MAAEQEKTTNFIDKLFQAKTTAEITACYDDWSASYEAQIQQYGYKGPQIVADLCAKYVSPDKEVIDIGAGTGLVGLLLKGAGFTTIDALDASQKMLDLAREKNCYRKIICEILEEQKPTSIAPGSYDAAVSFGSFSPGHLNADHLKSVVQMLRPGGKIVLGMREMWLNGPYDEPYKWPYDMQGTFDRWEAEKKWKLLAKDRVDNSVGKAVGVYFVFEIL